MPLGEYAATGGKTAPPEDCRDFLRTGRCKYGASCKYNHPANVQVGGGVREPVNPSEPMFPVRPDQPLCQYYMKHGNCKFGQACKFHHPAEALATASGQTFSQTSRQVDAAPQLVMNTVSTDVNGQPMVVQFLPQRPEEADCIYFLKNGRCKYGSTCRFHHPIGQKTTPQRPRSDSFGPQQVQYVAHPLGSTSIQGQNFLVPDGSVTLHPVNLAPEVGYGLLRGGTARTEVGSSASSIASSFDTASTSHEFVQGDIPGLWTRARRNGSGGSLNAHLPPSRPMRAIASDGNIISRNRALSHGSSNDPGLYYEVRESSPSSPGPWREYRNQERSPSHIRGTYNLPPQPRRPTARRSNGQQRGNDEGFAMMTSSLLNMLDTPEEASGESVSDDDLRYQAQQRYLQQEHIDHLLFQRMTLNDNTLHPGHAGNNREDSWSPSWPGIHRPSGPRSPDSASYPTSGAEGSGDGSDVGLYLP